MTYLDFDLEGLLDSFDLDDPFLLFVQVLNGVFQFSLRKKHSMIFNIFSVIAHQNSFNPLSINNKFSRNIISKKF